MTYWINIILQFFIFGFAGWCMEVILKYRQFHRFINRGFLTGPILPIYGFGVILITIVVGNLASVESGVVMTFALSLVICGIVEYLTSFVLEKIFHARWWDYSHKRFNLNGRVCADTLIPFGLLGMLMVYVVKPFLFGLMDRMPEGALHVLCAALLAGIVFDAALSVTVLSKIRKTATLSGEDDTEAITRAVREHLAKNSALARRVLAAFPYAKLYNKPLMEKIKSRRREIRREIEQKLKRQA